MPPIDATTEDIDLAAQQAWKAFLIYRREPLERRAEFMRAIATELENKSASLLRVAAEETNLAESRLRTEWLRTIFQLNSYADACRDGSWLDVRINTAVADRTPPKPDLRKMLVPLGPVAVFGASNFPFAYSTAGGDTACAFAAGCPVIVKAHPAHIRTSELVAGAIGIAVSRTAMPQGIFSHLTGAANEVGEALVKHPLVKAVGFTGSFVGGKQIFDWANGRREPIPVFAEMSSVNPVFLLPEKLRKTASELAKKLSSSITVGVGQFCTNPGLIFGVESASLRTFIKALGEEIRKMQPATMLHAGIFKNYVERRGNALAQEAVEMVAAAEVEPLFNQALPTIATVTGESFMANPVLHQEVFGPFSLVVRCRDMKQMIQIAGAMEGQLTTSLMATNNDIAKYGELVEAAKNICGRLVLNGVPTGVEVCQAMHHGGPFPATTDSRFTSVGSDGIRRFARPITYQNWPDELLPQELQNANPLGLWRSINNQITKDGIS